MISIGNLNDKIKTREFLMTALLVIKEKLNENLLDIILDYTDIIKIPKEKLKGVFGLITLITNRIYYMYNNEIADWMNFYNHNNYQVIIWKKNKVDINSIMIDLLKSHFKFNITIINNHSFKLNENTFIINNKNPLIKIIKI